MNKCRNCLIPETVPDISINEKGICNLCSLFNENEPMQLGEEERLAREDDLEKAIKANKGQSEYDCIVPFSGGKDSVYLLYRLKVEYGLKVLAYTANINLPSIAWKNIHQTLEKLNVDHLTFTPPRSYFQKLFRYLLTHQEKRGAVYTVSYVYAPIFEGDAIKLAIEKDIPLILAGYSPGQPDPERMLYEFSPTLISEVDWTPPHLKECGYFTDEELACFYNPSNYPGDTVFPRYLAPYHAWKYDQGEIMKQVVGQGLIANSAFASPVLSNYPINWLMMYSDLKHFHYNPYAPEFSELIRTGKASRNYWRIMWPIFNFMTQHKVLLGRHGRKCMQWLNLTDDDLRITLPQGVYDPVITDE